MAHNYLLEIGLEEMPAHVVTPSINQLHQRVADYLTASRIDFDTIKQFATPRRLALLITGLSDQQPDVEVDAKGPAKRIALDEDGNWTKAAQGFTRGQGATVDDIEFKTVKGVEYVFVHKHVAGKPVATVLAGLDQVIEKMTFPTMMHWGRYKLNFVRPIHWLVSLLDDQVVPFSILDITADRMTRGHRFLGHDLTIPTATAYEDLLLGDYVMADQDRRKTTIQDQIDQLVTDSNWVLDPDPNLLEEVNNLVEWPTAFVGHFDPQYLSLPEPVLITSMRDNQRFFCVRDQAGKLQPAFIAVRNGNREYLDNVIKGNERVLVPRLEDARFFFNEDQKLTIDQYVERLKHVSFHDQISSMYDKMGRTRVLADLLAQKLGLTASERADLARAASIYKFDLTTQMVGEFAELQGIMGEIYARRFGEKADVATAIREHYLPTSAEGDLPKTKLGAILALADKLDSIYAFFAVGLLPSGSNDPYALRRQAYGIVRILAANDWRLDLLDFEQPAAAAVMASPAAPKFDYGKNAAKVRTFFLDRIKQYFSEQALRHDIVDAVTDTNVADLATIMEAAQVIDAAKDDPQLKEQIEALTRVIRLAKQGNLQDDEIHVDPALFENPSEAKLDQAVQDFIDHKADQSLADQYAALRGLAPLIGDYFTENMIMADDPAVKQNRLALLTILADQTAIFGNLDRLIVK